MSLDFTLTAKREVDVYEGNITHNLCEMAEAAGIYDVLWNPIEKGYSVEDIIPILEKGLSDLRMNPDKFKQFNASNGWGKYEHLVSFVQEVLNACYENRDAKIEVSK